MSVRRDGIIVAIDGPAGSGKSSTARAVAAELGYRHLDSGALYRAITLAALDAAIPLAQWPGITAECLDEFQVALRPVEREYRIFVGGADVHDRIRSPEVNAHVSSIAALPPVRDWLLGALRDAGRHGGLVADGRDIGTVVFPDAELKIFLVCAPAERARRRLAERGRSEPSERELRAETSRLLERDRRDESRDTAPLLRAPDAVLLDTTGLAFAAQVRAIVALARSRMPPL
jgi:cytidylate kinase